MIAAEPSPWVATELELRVAATPAALTVVRRVTGGLAVALGFDDSEVADLRLAVTEVCASFIAARPEHDGPDEQLHVTADLLPDALRMCVRDPASPPLGPGTGPPLALLAALTRTLELHGVPGGGMEVRMTFAAPAPG